MHTATPDEFRAGHHSRIVLTRADRVDANMRVVPGCHDRLSAGSGVRLAAVPADVNAHLPATWSLATANPTFTPPRASAAGDRSKAGERR
ncbi:hypothetical protein GCM10022226_46440 [Sphaerisporangium flaviroseum]|uniref:Uncharacterized protein n=1 Tax=Sphaerisporangium flaviroseum TaxID=509199 RepID=A0ABP7IKK0_9ACTN